MDLNLETFLCCSELPFLIVAIGSMIMISLQIPLVGLVSLLSAKAVLAQTGSMMQGGGWGMGWMGGYGGIWGPLILVAVLVAVVILVIRGKK